MRRQSGPRAFSSAGFARPRRRALLRAGESRRASRRSRTARPRARVPSRPQRRSRRSATSTAAAATTATSSAPLPATLPASLRALAGAPWRRRQLLEIGLAGVRFDSDDPARNTWRCGDACLDPPDRLERTLVARRGCGGLRPRLGLRARLGRAGIAARKLRDGVQDRFDRSRDEPVGLQGSSSGRSGHSHSCQAGKREAGDRLDIHLAAPDQRFDPVMIEVARRPFVRPASRSVGPSVSRAAAKKMHDLGGVPGCQRHGAERDHPLRRAAPSPRRARARRCVPAPRRAPACPAGSSQRAPAERMAPLPDENHLLVVIDRDDRDRARVSHHLDAERACRRRGSRHPHRRSAAGPW